MAAEIIFCRFCCFIMEVNAVIVVYMALKLSWHALAADGTRSNGVSTNYGSTPIAKANIGNGNQMASPGELDGTVDLWYRSWTTWMNNSNKNRALVNITKLKLHPQAEIKLGHYQMMWLTRNFVSYWNFKHNALLANTSEPTYEASCRINSCLTRKLCCNEWVHQSYE